MRPGRARCAKEDEVSDIHHHVGHRFFDPHPAEGSSIRWFAVRRFGRPAKRRSRHCRLRRPISISAMFSQLQCLGVPLRDRSGDVAGSLSVTMPIGQESREDAVSRVLSVLSETAQAIRNLI